jgi:hypothetical protein
LGKSPNPQNPSEHVLTIPQLCHCHIGWHTEEGFALKFVERYDEIAALYNATELEAGCKTWDTWQTDDGLVQDDSGV